MNWLDNGFHFAIVGTILSALVIGTLFIFLVRGAAILNQWDEEEKENYDDFYVGSRKVRIEDGGDGTGNSNKHG